jgi:antitoxin ParD1/3/4
VFPNLSLANCTLKSIGINDLLRPGRPASGTYQGLPAFVFTLHGRQRRSQQKNKENKREALGRLALGLVVGAAGTMGTRKTITLTDKQDQWIKAQIAASEYTNDSEYIRDLVRRDQEENAKFLALKQAIHEGLGSGVSDKSVTDIMEEVESRLRADSRL